MDYRRTTLLGHKNTKFKILQILVYTQISKVFAEEQLKKNIQNPNLSLIQSQQYIRFLPQSVDLINKILSKHSLGMSKLTGKIIVIKATNNDVWEVLPFL